MSKTDQEIWEETLEDEESVDLFKIKPGGENAKPLSPKNIFKTPKEKKIEERIKKLEEQVKTLTSQLNATRALREQVKKLSKRVGYTPQDIGTNRNENKD